MERVIVKKCDQYNQELVTDKLATMIDRLGGFKSFISPGDRVILKVNLLKSCSPERAVTTHPVIVKSISRLVLEAGGRVIIADSPGGRFTGGVLNNFYRECGLKEVASLEGVELNYNTEYTEVSFKKGKVSKAFPLCNFLTEADVIINVPKLKTHGLTLYTGAIKNLYGAIPGLRKADYHLRMQDPVLFSQMLLDLFQLIKPDLSIMDGITGMEGEGPSGGITRDFNYLMASKSALALDIAGAYLMGISPLQKSTIIKAASERGLVSDISDIKMEGDVLEPAKNVKLPVIPDKSNLLDQRIPGPVARFMEKLLLPRPVFNDEECTGCGKCIQNCPDNAIEMIGDNPEVELSDCIRCFCCQELCPEEAVRLKYPLLGKLIFK